MQKRNRPISTFTLDQDLIDGLDALRDRDGVSASETVRRAVRAWLESKRILKRRPAAGRRVSK
jgi:Arc/MetJ-type ribon-helix-helix transcriptional regulator